MKKMFSIVLLLGLVAGCQKKEVIAKKPAKKAARVLRKQKARKGVAVQSRSSVKDVGRSGAKKKINKAVRKHTVKKK